MVRIPRSGLNFFQALIIFRGSSDIQLFRERLSYKRGNAYATMSKVIIGNGDFTVAWLKPKVFHSPNKEYSCFLFLLTESPWTSIKQNYYYPLHQSALSRTLLRFCETTFVETAVYFMYSLVFFIIYGCITNKQCNQLPNCLIAQLVEYCTGIAEVMGSNPVQARMFFEAKISQLLKLCA